jgi:hypothetical protein
MKNRNIQFHPTAGLVLALLLAAFPLMFLEYDASAQSAGDLPEAAEPQLCSDGYWCADFNQAQIACYLGSMQACDSIWLSERVLSNTGLHDYGRSCGGRVDVIALRRAFSGGYREPTCAEIFPGH